jgi:ATP-binding cassette subfamily B (MDR/TAP) protein 9
MLGLCAVSIVPFVGVINKKYGDWLGRNAKAVQNALADANATAQEAFSLIRTVIAFASEDNETEKYSGKVENYYHLNMKQLYMTGFYYMLVSTFLINTVVKAALLYIGTLLIQKGRITPEILLAFMLYQGSLQNETQNLLNSYTSLIKSSGAGDKVFALLDRRPEAPGTGSPEVVLEVDGNGDGAPIESGGVELRGVGFAYSSRPDHVVLDSLSLSIPSGSTLALVGPSGCGKSTVISLLERFYDPTQGSVLICGQDLKSLPLKKHRMDLSIVTQEPLLFSGTILSNILYGCPNASFEDVIQAAKLANAHDFIESFPDKVGSGK